MIYIIYNDYIEDYFILTVLSIRPCRRIFILNMPMLSKTAAEAEKRLKLLYWWYVWGGGGNETRVWVWGGQNVPSSVKLYIHLSALTSTKFDYGFIRIFIWPRDIWSFWVFIYGIIHLKIFLEKWNCECISTWTVLLIIV